MEYPVKIKTITSPYGDRTLQGQPKAFHYGTDFTGQNKIAIAPCDIIIDRIKPVDPLYPCRFDFVDGKFVENKNIPEGRAWSPYVIAHAVNNDNLSFVFKHVLPIVKAGEMIPEGEGVGQIGNYGFSMGGHLHFEVLLNGKNVDPAKWLVENVG